MPVDLLALGAALVTGALGGVHCAAMCGGIAVTMAGAAPSRGDALRRALTLNVGRVLGYALAGGIVGALGAGILAVFRHEALAVALRSAVGAVMIIAALRLLDRRGRFAALNAPAVALWRRLSPLTRSLLPANTWPRRLALGALWGWLPCGLSATLLAAAWLSADALNGALLMAAFGTGTLLVMLPLTWSGARASQWLARPTARGAAAGAVALSGVATLAAPWLGGLPAVHATLAALGCASAF